MGFNNDRYFVLSGFISLGFFFLLLFLIGFSILKSVNIQQFAMQQSDIVSIAVTISEMKAEPKSQAEPTVSAPEPQPVQKEPEVVPEEPKPAPVEDISDLFSQVKPVSVPKKKVDDRKRVDELNALEKELMRRTDETKLSEKVKNTELAKPSVNMTVEGGSTGPVVNEYHAKIQGLVHTNFHPPQGTQGQVARIKVKISASGKMMWYKIRSLSGNQAFDSEVQWLKERLDKVTFPPHPEGRDTILEFILKAKE